MLLCLGSELVHCDVLGSHIVVVNSAKAANEIFVKRSAIYSDRYRIIAASFGPRASLI